jgi:hypothetical protein
MTNILDDTISEVKQETQKSNETENEISSFLSAFNSIEHTTIEDEKKEGETELEKTETQTNSLTPVNDEPKKRGRKPKVKIDNTTQTISGSVIDAGLVLLVIDIAIPALIIFTYKKLKKSKQKLNIEKLRLTKTQLNELTPILEKVLAKSSFEAQPLPMLIIAMGSMYFLNFMEMTNE